tara:strand:+ start:313 stop:1722 length:1410 start_codon:yes stop_codon:yes gene_type:complete
MRSRVLPFALALSGAIHAAVIGIAHDAAPTLTIEPALTYTTQLDAVLIDAVQDKGETPLPSEAAADSVASAGKIDPHNKLEEKLESLEQFAASLQKELSEVQAERAVDISRYQNDINALLEKNALSEQDNQNLSTIVTELEETQQTLSAAVTNLAHDLDLERNANRELQANHRKTEAALNELLIEKEAAVSEKKQLLTQLSKAQSAFEEVVVQLHDTASALDETGTENQELVRALASSEQAASVLRSELDNLINEADLERHAMDQALTTVEENLQAASIELETERASNERLQAETNRLDQMLTALQIDQKKDQATYTEVNARLTDAVSALRSTEEENDALRRELSHTQQNAADLKEQLDQAQASKASLDTGNALSDLRPVPAAGNPKPVYPRMAIRRGIEGEVELSVSVSPLGQVSRISINKPSGFAMLDQAAIDSVKQWQFTPAVRDGVPTAMVIDIPVQFRLIDSRG